jgi:hypothetical protein
MEQESESDSFSTFPDIMLGRVEMEDLMTHSEHSLRRSAQRGVTNGFIEAILTHADIERPIGDNCRLVRVSRLRSQRLNIDDRLGRYAVIWSDDTARVVTIMPVHEGAAGRPYRRRA